MIPLAFTMRLLREDSKSNKLAVLRSAWDWDGIVPNCIMGRLWGRFLTQSLSNSLWWPIKKALGSPKQSRDAKGHFRVSPGLCINTRLSAQPLIWKWFFILMQIRLIFTRKVLHLASFWKWGFWKTEVAYSTRHLPDPVQRATAKWPIRCNNRVGQPKARNDNQNCRGSIQVLTNLRPKHSTPSLDTSL